MFFRSSLRRARKSAGIQMSPLDLFTQVQVGYSPPTAMTKQYIIDNFSDVLHNHSLNPSKVRALDPKVAIRLLKRLFYDKYLSLPFRYFTFDFEFTGLPHFTEKGPSEEILEMAFYHPPSKQTFSKLIKPAKALDPAIEALCGINQEVLKKEKATTFEKAWSEALEFLKAPRPNEVSGSEERILLLSHGGKLADVSMLTWAVKQKLNEELPSNFHFGDTFSLVRDIHRKRPVTPDRHPPSWALSELAMWLKLPVEGKVHRAAVDAKVTWDVLFRHLDLYGDETLSPEQQLVGRFFDDAAKRKFDLGTQVAAIHDDEPSDAAADVEI